MVIQGGMVQLEEMVVQGGNGGSGWYGLVGYKGLASQNGDSRESDHEGWNGLVS